MCRHIFPEYYQMPKRISPARPDDAMDVTRRLQAEFASAERRTEADDCRELSRHGTHQDRRERGRRGNSAAVAWGNAGVQRQPRADRARSGVAALLDVEVPPVEDAP
jgi:hypothetical protein